MLRQRRWCWLQGGLDIDGEDADGDGDDEDVHVDEELVEDARDISLTEHESHKGFWSKFVEFYFGGGRVGLLTLVEEVSVSCKVE
jgi:hypothetical protein